MTKLISALAVLLFIVEARALQSKPEELYRVESETKEVEPLSSTRSVGTTKPVTEELPKKVEPRKPIIRKPIEAGNLPVAYGVRSIERLVTTTAVVVLPPSNVSAKLKDLNVGETYEAVINHSVIAFTDEKSPVVAIITRGELAGCKVVGESRLEPNTKRIFIDFQTLVRNRELYKLNAKALGPEGQPGLIGEYHSREGWLFAGDFIASMVGAYFDGLIPRKRNVFGYEEDDVSVNSAIKKGAAAGAMSTAERFREKLKKVPEFSELHGPSRVKVLNL